MLPRTPTLAPLIARTARLGQIRAAWPRLIQLAASIRSGQVSAAHAVATLAATSRQSALAAALAEIGRIERSIFTLEWMLEPELRHRVQTGLNKGEARNNLARAVFLNRLGQMHDRTHDDQQHRAAGCNLVVAAIILWNTVYLAAAAEAPDAAASTCQMSCSDMSGRWAGTTSASPATTVGARTTRASANSAPFASIVSERQIPLNGDSGTHRPSHPIR